MPLIRIYGLPLCLGNQEPLRELDTGIRSALSAIEQLGLTNNQVSIVFPASQLLDSSGSELIGEVAGLFPAPKGKAKRDHALCALLTVTIGHQLLAFTRAHLPDCTMIEVSLPDRPEPSLWQWRKRT